MTATQIAISKLSKLVQTTSWNLSKIPSNLTLQRIGVTLLSDGEYIEPFVFDTFSAHYLLHTGSIDLSADSLKKAFRKSPKSEVLAMHVMRDRVALEGQINAIVVHLDFYGQGTNPHGYFRDQGGAEMRLKAGELIVLDFSLRHLLVISKVSKLMGTPVCMAVEWASD